MIVYLSFGSNMGDRVGAIQQAVSMLKDNPAVRVLSTSSLYETEPVGFADQEWFVNAATAIDTSLSPEALLDLCQQIEDKLGRVRDPNNRYGPRIIDIDILFYGEQVVDGDELIIPHPRLHERAFMLVPLLEVNPRQVHPILNKSVEQLHDDLEEPEEVLLYGTRRPTYTDRLR